MKISIILFSVFMLFSSVMMDEKCDCDGQQMIEQRFFLKGKLKRIYYGDHIYQVPGNDVKYFIEGKRIICDSISILPAKKRPVTFVIDTIFKP